ncbi:MAG: adenylate kinase [Thaumarchaeota archaeon]|nr:adenylate kinase [Nitrososphaerota archaeon]
MRLRVVTVGIAGVGKTTVVEKLLSMTKGAKLVTFGSVMLEEGKRRRLVKHRDELRKLPVERQKELQRLTAARISRMKEAIVLVDTHLFIRTEEGFWPGLPFEVVRALKPTHLVLVEASPDEISQRRAQDKLRYRDSADRGSLLEELSLARVFLAVASNLTGAPMLTLTNSDGKADATARKIATMMRKASS